MTDYVWPDLTAILDVLSGLLAESDPPQSLQVRSTEDLAAGFERARNALGYLEDHDAAVLAALMFEGVAMRHPLVDGNKRLAFLCMAVFLSLNKRWFDASEMDAYDAVIALIEKRSTVEDLAAFIRAHSRAKP